MSTLAQLVQDWQQWSISADRSENGWQSDFPEWEGLMTAAAAAMVDPFSHSVQTESEIELCWSLSEEGEDLADYAKAHTRECMPILRRLHRSRYSEVRWQVYSVLGFAGREGEELLRESLNDPDPYCRRRALLSLARLRPDDAESIARRFLEDDDSYIRQAARELALSAKG